MRPWRRDRDAGPGEPAPTAMTNTALGIAIGPSIGMCLSLAIGGADGHSDVVRERFAAH